MCVVLVSVCTYRFLVEYKLVVKQYSTTTHVTRRRLCQLKCAEDRDCVAVSYNGRMCLMVNRTSHNGRIMAKYWTLYLKEKCIRLIKLSHEEVFITYQRLYPDTVASTGCLAVMTSTLLTVYLLLSVKVLLWTDPNRWTSIDWITGCVWGVFVC